MYTLYMKNILNEDTFHSNSSTYGFFVIYRCKGVIYRQSSLTFGNCDHFCVLGFLKTCKIVVL